MNPSRWLLLCVAVLIPLTLVGCSFLERAKTTATTPKEGSGETPIKEILAAMPRAMSLDPTAIASIVGNLAWIILGGLGAVGVGTGAVAYQVRSYKTLRADGVPVVSTPSVADPSKTSPNPVPPAAVTA